MRTAQGDNRRIARLVALLLLLLVYPSCCFQPSTATKAWTHRHSTPGNGRCWHPTPPFRRQFGTKRPIPPRTVLSGFVTSFHALPLSLLSPSVSALLALVSATAAGYLSEKIVPNVGILVTLLAAAVLSNLQLAPVSHPLYDLCWVLFLPASLAFLLLSSSPSSSLNDNASDDDASSTSTSMNDSQVVQTIKTVAVPFAVGSIGSILGCIASFLICRQWPTLWLSPQNDAVLAASCLCSSYIGGSVNFFATANLLGGSKRNSNLMTSMAAADLMVMAIYFCFLTAALQSKILLKLFDGNDATTADAEDSSNGDDVEVEMDTIVVDDDISGRDTAVSRKQTAVATLSVSTLAFLIVQISNRVERILARSTGLPGTACAVIALLTTLVSRYASKLSNNALSVWKKMQLVAAPWSQVCFHLLFASIGMSANIANALKAGPACLWFSMTALLIHVLVILIGSLACKRVFPNIELQHVLVASNAAIGGPATAAAFCGQVKQCARGLTLAATVCGIVGYAVGTGIGDALARVLAAMA